MTANVFLGVARVEEGRDDRQVERTGPALHPHAPAFRRSRSRHRRSPPGARSPWRPDERPPRRRADSAPAFPPRRGTRATGQATARLALRAPAACRRPPPPRRVGGCLAPPGTWRTSGSPQPNANSPTERRRPRPPAARGSPHSASASDVSAVGEHPPWSLGPPPSRAVCTTTSQGSWVRAQGFAPTHRGAAEDEQGRTERLRPPAGRPPAATTPLPPCRQGDSDFPS